MALDVKPPLILGNYYSYASIELIVNAIVISEVTSINYADHMDFGMKQGTSRQPIGSTSGVYTPQEGSLTLSVDALNRLLTATGPGYLGALLNLTVCFADIGMPVATDLIQAKLAGISNGFTYGPDGLDAELQFMPLQPTIRNGVPALLNRL